MANIYSWLNQEKSPIFVIVEAIFEPRINAFMKTKKDEA